MDDDYAWSPGPRLWDRLRGKAPDERIPPDPVNRFCDGGVHQLFGYLDGKRDAKLFYWLFESRTNPTTSPTLIYFQGGPGASSMLSAVSGNGGPCILNEDGTSPSVNEYSWNTFANVMYIDQPASVGFSKGTPPNNSIEAAKSTVQALEIFFRAHPEYNTEVFLTGQSYAEWTALRPKVSCNFQLGSSLLLCGLLKGLASRVEEKGHDPVRARFNNDIAKRYDTLLIPALNTGKRVLVFAGDQDYSCNWIGNRAWTDSLEWDGFNGCKMAKDTLFELPDGTIVGKLKTFTLPSPGGQLSFLQVFKAGHNAARDSPAAVHKAMANFVTNQLR
ncbi:hypothetical protein FOL47_009907 [Perkinsus chesapeaki]|uniref:Thymus-specific serine protease n=1 Tax=Perkinsus chesapeaki TaxID=330153 RepID=A0A7J6L5W6_PERCH|nr:hypothetical protein FOL47_009907 [Perkinsus chesapeaki]